MNEGPQELKKRITQLPDEQLLEMVTAEAGNYRQDALEYAKAELTSRGIDFQDSSAEAAPPHDEPERTGLPLNPLGPACLVCGGRTRAGTLVAEKEMTIVFSDNREERFVKVNACTQCGQLLLVADYDTDVQA